MAVIDTLVNLIAAQRAEGLLIASDQVPRLIFGEEERPLSMPPIAAATVAHFASEVGAQAGEIDGVGAATRYATDAGAEFDVRVERSGEAISLLFQPAGGRASAPPASDWPDPHKDEFLPEAPGVATGELHALQPTDPLHEWLTRLEAEGASDLILSSGASARLRSAGALRELPGPPLGDSDILALFEPTMDELARQQLARHGSVDLAFEIETAGLTSRYRVNIFKQHRGVAAALRPIRRDPPSLRDLNLPDHLYELVELRNGLVLVTGPTGSGKSTTLAALVEHLNRCAERHIITLEDPIEYLYEARKCLIHQREVGRHVESFATGLRAALREDPDVILVGEMRDRDTIAAALTAAETGHLVLSTLHSATPWTSIDRMIDVFPADQQRQVRLQLSDVLRSIVSQHLLPSTAPPLRIPAYEKLQITSAVASQIRDDKLHQIQSSIQTGRDNGMVSLERSLAELLRAGRITPETARAAAHDERSLADLTRGQ